MTTTRYSRTVEERFWEHVDKRGPDDCWLWTGQPHNTKWHGKIKIQGVNIAAHRVSWQINVGPIGDKQVLHTCDVAKCVNPKHLFLGTQQDNIADMVAKGRARGGSGRLNPELVGQIRLASAAGTTQVTIEKQYGLSSGTVSRVINRKIWAWV